MKSYPSYNNHILLKLLSESDQFAFTEIYERYWQKLFVIAYNRLKEVQAAEDIVHDVFTSLWKNRHKSEIESLENYLATSTKYMVLDKIKRKERERLYQNSVHQAPVFELGIENSLHYKRILEIVRNEVELLPEKCRLIFKYSRNEGMPVKQIAEELHISPRTVENQLNNGLPDSAIWGFETTGNAYGWGNNEKQHYTDGDTSNAIVSNGTLKIIARKEAKENKQYTSARLSSSKKASFRYGKIEIRAKLPPGKGTWPAIWMLGNNKETTK